MTRFETINQKYQEAGVSDEELDYLIQTLSDAEKALVELGIRFYAPLVAVRLELDTHSRTKGFREYDRERQSVMLVTSQNGLVSVERGPGNFGWKF